MSVQLSDLFSITHSLYRLHIRSAKVSGCSVTSDNHHTPTPTAVMLTLKKSVSTLTSPLRIKCHIGLLVEGPQIRRKYM